MWEALATDPGYSLLKSSELREGYLNFFGQSKEMWKEGEEESNPCVKIDVSILKFWAETTSEIFTLLG